jgi:hypothetical protein
MKELQPEITDDTEVKKRKIKEEILSRNFSELQIFTDPESTNHPQVSGDKTL